MEAIVSLLSPVEKASLALSCETFWADYTIKPQDCAGPEPAKPDTKRRRLNTETSCQVGMPAAQHSAARHSVPPTIKSSPSPSSEGSGDIPMPDAAQHSAPVPLDADAAPTSAVAAVHNKRGPSSEYISAAQQVSEKQTQRRISSRIRDREKAAAEAQRQGSCLDNGDSIISDPNPAPGLRHPTCCTAFSAAETLQPWACRENNLPGVFMSGWISAVSPVSFMQRLA